VQAGNLIQSGPRRRNLLLSHVNGRKSPGLNTVTRTIEQAQIGWRRPRYRSPLREQPGLIPYGTDHFDGVLVEARENLSSCSPAIESDHTIGEISASFENGKASFCCRPVNQDARAFDQFLYGGCDFRRSSVIATNEHPGEFAKRRQRRRDGFRFKERAGGKRALRWIVHDRLHIFKCEVLFILNR
jgi:hypothetical protein